jgi:hypothetical protein
MTDYQQQQLAMSAELEALMAQRRAGRSVRALLLPHHDWINATLDSGVSATDLAKVLQKHVAPDRAEATVRKAIRKVVEVRSSTRRRGSRNRRSSQANGRPASRHADPNRKPTEQATGHVEQAAPPAASTAQPMVHRDLPLQSQAGLPLGPAEKTPDWMSQSPIRRVTDDR